MKQVLGSSGTHLNPLIREWFITHYIPVFYSCLIKDQDNPYLFGRWDRCHGFIFCPLVYGELGWGDVVYSAPWTGPHLFLHLMGSFDWAFIFWFLHFIFLFALTLLIMTCHSDYLDFVNLPLGCHIEFVRPPVGLLNPTNITYKIMYMKVHS
jgi:hypothetical protein